MSIDPRFLAHALALEEEAMLRYGELAQSLEIHHNHEVAAFFRQMSEESALHLAEVRDLAGDTVLPELAAWDFDWQAEAPESTSYEALHYRMDMRNAVALALQNERSAESWYQQAAEAATDPATATLARQFAAEERDHAERLTRRLDALPASSPHHEEDDDPAHTPE